MMSKFKLLKKIVLMCLLLISLLLIVGCSAKIEPASEFKYKQGIHEVEYSLLNNAPPSELYPESDFKVIVQVDNQAAYDVNNLVINLVGFNDRYFQFEGTMQQYDYLLGRSLEAPAGDKAFLEFKGKTGQLFQNAEHENGVFFLKSSYSSTFDFTDTVCINPNLYAVDKTGCLVEEKKSYSGQGAPITVNNIQEITYPSGVGAEVEFRIFVRNRGKGDLKRLSVSGAKLGARNIQCEFVEADSNPLLVQFIDMKQEATLRCRGYSQESYSYTTTLFVTFSYDYEYKQKHVIKLLQ
jgi:hypothetical protein